VDLTNVEDNDKEAQQDVEEMYTWQKCNLLLEINSAGCFGHHATWGRRHVLLSLIYRRRHVLVAFIKWENGTDRHIDTPTHREKKGLTDVSPSGSVV
jgi:hypothetical protein